MSCQRMKYIYNLVECITDTRTDVERTPWCLGFCKTDIPRSDITYISKFTGHIDIT